MSRERKGCLFCFLAGVFLLCLALGSTAVCAKEISEIKEEIAEIKEETSEKAEELDEKKEELQEINEELLAMGQQIAEVEEDIEETNTQIEQTSATLEMAKNKEAEQSQAMKRRIRYMYENDDASFLSMIFEAQSMQEFLNAVDFIQSITEYDREALGDLLEIRQVVQEQEKELEGKKANLVTLETDLKVKESEMETKAAETSTDIQALKGKIAQLKSAERAKREEQARKEAEEAARKAREEAERRAKEAAAQAAQAAAASAASGGGSYNYPSGNGVLTKFKGVNYFNGHKETYYSQRVLPGGGLKIPGRHVRSDGVICDADGYVCVANVDHPKGTVIQTSLGPGKVYDTGCAHGVVDIYTDW